MIVYQFLDSPNFRTGESTTPLQPSRLEPELCDLTFTLNMNMWRFVAVSCIKEETVGPNLNTVGIYSIIVV
jgi:hypothetical protein